MKAKKFKHKGAIMIEVVLCISINVLLLLGGLEWSRYLYIRQGLAEAAGQAVQNSLAKNPDKVVELALVGLDFSDTLIAAVNVSVSQVQLGGGAKADMVTVSMPVSDGLLFGGTFSGLAALSDGNITATAYFPQ